MLNTSELLERLNKDFDGSLALTEDSQAVSVNKVEIIKLLQLLKEKHGFEMLLDITSAEYNDRLEVVYHLMNLENAGVLRVKTGLSKQSPSVASSIPVWKAADVMEREIFDLMGIVFEGHGNLKRILCPEDFEGHPLRKDFKPDIIERF